MVSILKEFGEIYFILQFGCKFNVSRVKEILFVRFYDALFAFNEAITIDLPKRLACLSYKAALNETILESSIRIVISSLSPTSPLPCARGA